MSFNALQEKDFFGRQEELAGLNRAVLPADAGMARSAVLSGPRGIGKSELLKRLFGALFWRQDRTAPFYYAVNPALLSAADFAKSYLVRFLCQRLAFEKKEQALLQDDGMPLSGVSALIEDRGADWAGEIIEQFVKASADPLDALRIALAAPRKTAITSGVPVAVLIDDFHLLNSLRIEGAAGARLVSLFAEPLSYRKTPYVITGNAPELREMPVASGLEWISVPPLGPQDASARLLSVLRAHEAEGSAPSLLLRRLGGNPLYLGCVARTAARKKRPEERDFWDAYLHEIREGALASSWSSVLKRFFPDLGQRRLALAITHKVHHTATPLSCQQIAKSFALTDSEAEAIAHGLYLAGLIRGEFGVFRASDDAVLRDIVACLYLSEILAKPAPDLEREFLEKLPVRQEEAARFDLVLPMAKESELVAAQCLEQIGKNMRLNQDAIGQMQIAVIEACINAIEHSKGADDRFMVGIAVDADRLEVSIESAGREFIELETGEPFGDREAARTSGRGWGMKLMKRYADEVRFEKTGRGTKLVLVKKLAASAGVQTEDRVNHE
jgi:serine/threonine-protein kinase RsbW